MFKKILGLVGVAACATVLTACKDDDTTDKKPAPGSIEIKVNFATNKTAQDVGYSKDESLTMPDGTIISDGMIKPTWQLVADIAGVTLVDNTTAGTAKDMITFEATAGFTASHIYGGNSVGGDLMTYGAQGDFVNLSQEMKDGNMPALKAYFDKNPAMAQAVTAFDGNIYHVPYIAEVGNYARMWYMRDAWVNKITDSASTFDTGVVIDTKYEASYAGDNSRTKTGGKVVNPTGDVKITKATDENIIEIMNALPTKDGASLAKALNDYIDRNYMTEANPYKSRSEFFLGDQAAYDVDEMVALLRVVETNPVLLTGKSDSTMVPLIQRKGMYRDEYLKFASLYIYGERIHAADSFGSTYEIDKDGALKYTIYKESTYNTIASLADMYAEGLFADDCLDDVNQDVRVKYWSQTPAETKGEYGFMLFDFTAGATSEALTHEVVGVMPPVANINGAWQYYVDNARAIKPDGWAISTHHEQAEIDACVKIFDYMFTEEGNLLQNYGPEDLRDLDAVYKGADGVDYPAFNEWTQKTYLAVGAGDVSKFLREWIGSLNPVGYVKSFGIELQTTSQRGLDAHALYKSANIGMQSYAGDLGIDSSKDYHQNLNSDQKAYNPNFYKMVPPVFSLTEADQKSLDEVTCTDDETAEILYNTIRYTYNNAGGVKVYKSAEEYMAAYKAAGAETYQAVYAKAFKATQA